MSFHERLKHERELRGWSQSYLASRLGCPAKSVNRWEKDKLPGAKYRRLLLELFEMDAEEFGLLQQKPSRRTSNTSTSIFAAGTTNGTSPDSAAVPARALQSDALIDTKNAG